MSCSVGATRTLGQFALVSYLPNPMAEYLDSLRLQLTPNCHPRAHVTVLPPRPFTGELRETVADLTCECSRFPRFEVDTGDIEVFPLTNVIYLSLRRGEPDLHALYENLNAGQLEYHEPFPYHPHVTVAQDFARKDADQLVCAAREAWSRYTGPRRFTVENLSFVQNVAPLTWVDVANVSLAHSLEIESAA